MVLWEHRLRSQAEESSMVEHYDINDGRGREGHDIKLYHHVQVTSAQISGRATSNGTLRREIIEAICGSSEDSSQR